MDQEIKILQRGAEALIYLKEGFVFKERIKKGYRITILDEIIRKKRTKSEANLLKKAYELKIDVPRVFSVEDNVIKMEYIQGEKLKDIFSSLGKEKRSIICKKIGEYIATLHNANIIHGDITTSNFLIKDDKVFLIDFGLGFHSTRIEDKATDLYILQQALKSTHFNIFNDLWEDILNSYKKNYKGSEAIIKRLEEINKRGRYKR
jgi:Kae1-associated kinase Bud32